MRHPEFVARRACQGQQSDGSSMPCSVFLGELWRRNNFLARNILQNGLMRICVWRGRHGGRKVAKFGRFRPDFSEFVRYSLIQDQLWPNFVKPWPCAIEVGSALVDSRSNSAQRGANLDDSRACLADDGQIRPQFLDLGLTLTTSGLFSAHIGPHRPDLGKNRLGFRECAQPTLIGQHGVDL